jgi:hypothetical protein
VVQDIQFGWKHILLGFTDVPGPFAAKNKDRITGFKLFDTNSKILELISIDVKEYSRFYILDNSVISTAKSSQNLSYLIRFQNFTLHIAASEKDCQINSLSIVKLRRSTMDEIRIFDLYYQKMTSVYQCVRNSKIPQGNAID